MTARTVHECLERFPGAALELSSDGAVRESNGRLDALVGRELVGEAFEDVLDSTSMGKWRAILSEAGRARPPCTWEMVVRTPTSLELRSFLAVWRGSGPEAALWLLEYAADPKLERLYEELSELHRELVAAQRQLGRERSRLVRALEKAESAVRTRDEVLAVISHDLRNPVGTILMAAELLGMSIPEERKSEQIEIIRRTAHGMNRLIGDLLDVSAIESGSLRIEPRPLALDQVLDEVFGMLEAHARGKRQRLDLEVPGGLPRVRGDRDRILQVLSNLIGNAIKFTPEGGAITVRTEPGKDEVIVSVEDDGPGIPEEDLPHVFDRYWRGSRRNRPGAGLGLAISRGIVEAQGGWIQVDSAPGRGSTFSFSVPVAGAA